MNNNILIVTPNNDTFTNPTITTLLHLLGNKGIEVILFGPEQKPECPTNITNIRVEHSKFKLFMFRNPRNYWGNWKSFAKVKRIIREKQIKIILAVDPLGLIIAGRIKRFLMKKMHLSYLSFEIFFKDELNGYYLQLKEKEIFYSKYIDSLLIQDDKRKQLLFRENNLHLPDERVALVPVSPMKIEVKEKLDLHYKLGITKDKKLAAYSGSVGEWCGTKAIIEAFDKGYWNKDFHLVFHTRKPIVEGTEFCVDLKRLDTDENAPFTLHPYPFDSFEALSVFLSGFDVALALYYPNNLNPYYGMNMKEIGLSSGKFSTYMMLGLPTIVTSCEIYKQLREKYHFGAVINDIKELKIYSVNDYSKEDVFSLYNDILDPEKGIIDFLRIIGFDKT